MAVYFLGMVKEEGFHLKVGFFTKRKRRKVTPPPNLEICRVWDICRLLLVSLGNSKNAGLFSQVRTGEASCDICSVLVHLEQITDF